MSFRTRRVALASTGLTCAAALTLGVASPAFARTSSTTPVASSVPTTSAPSTTPRDPITLEDIKTAGADAIATRESQLTKLSGRLSAAPNCDTNGHIASEIASDGPALQNLGTTLAADTTVAKARADFKSIFDDYRVYLVVTPQASVTSACGHIQTAVATLTKDETTLTSRVDAAAAAGQDMTAAKSSLADMSTKLTQATALGNQANTTLAGIAPDHGDKAIEASNKSAVDNARHAVEQAHADLTAAVKDARAVVADLKAVHNNR